MLTVTGDTGTGCNAAFELKPTIVGIGDETTEQFGLRFIAVSR